MENRDDREPCFVISVAARLVKMHPQTLRYYERVGLIEPSRRGKNRLYSEEDIARLQQIQRLINDLGVNLAGVEVIIRMSERMAEMERQMEEMHQAMEAEIQRLQRALAATRLQLGKKQSPTEDEKL